MNFHIFVIISFLATVYGFPKGKDLIEAEFDSAVEIQGTRSLGSSSSSEGYVYYEFFTGTGCTGDSTYITGVAANVCLPSSEYQVPGSYSNYGDADFGSFQIINLSDSCSGSSIVFYSDSSCKNLYRTKSLTASFTQCTSLDYPVKTNMVSYIGKCSIGSTLPLTSSSYVRELYSNTSECSGQSFSFDAYFNNTCYGNTDDTTGVKYTFNSSEGPITMTQYYSSNSCIQPSDSIDETISSIDVGCIKAYNTTYNSSSKYPSLAASVEYIGVSCQIIDSDNGNNNNLSNDQVTGIIIGVVVGALVLTSIAAYFIMGSTALAAIFGLKVASSVVQTKTPDAPIDPEAGRNSASFHFSTTSSQNIPIENENPMLDKTVAQSL